MTVLLSICLAACLTPRLTRRYRLQTQSTAEPGTIEAALSAFAMPVPAASAKATLTGLSERGQASLIRELGRLRQSRKRKVRRGL